MARPANPYSPILKRLSSLQAKADKLNAEIAAVTKMVADESLKISTPKAKPVAKKAAVKKASAPKTVKTKKPVKVSIKTAEEKTMARKAKVNEKARGKKQATEKTDYLSMLND